MPLYKFDDIAENLTAKRKPTEADMQTYIGLEHLESGSLFVHTFGSDVPIKGDKLIMTRGDVLLGKRNAYLKRAAIAPHDGLFSAHGMILRPKEKVVDRNFFPFFIASDVFFDEAIRISVGSLSPTINWRDLKEIEFNLPPLEEQRKLADLLWAAYDLKESYKRLLAASDEMAKSRFIEMFVDKLSTKKLDHFVVLITKGASPKWQGINYTAQGTLFITSENVQEGYIDLSKRKYVDSQINSIQPRSILHKGDILFNIVGASIGRAAVFDSNIPANINQAVALIRVNELLMNKSFLLYYLNSPRAKKVYSGMKKGVARDNLSLQNIRDFDVPDAPLPLQNEFAVFVEQLDKSKVALQESIEKLDDVIHNLLSNSLGGNS